MGELIQRVDDETQHVGDLLAPGSDDSDRKGIRPSRFPCYGRQSTGGYKRRIRMAIPRWAPSKSHHDGVGTFILREDRVCASFCLWQGFRPHHCIDVYYVSL